MLNICLEHFLIVTGLCIISLDLNSKFNQLDLGMSIQSGIFNLCNHPVQAARINFHSGGTTFQKFVNQVEHKSVDLITIKIRKIG